MNELLAIVVDFLHDDGWPVAAVPDDPTAVSTKVEASVGVFLCEARVDPPQRFAFYTRWPEPVPGHARAGVAEYLTRINSRLFVGNLELDFDTGEVRARASVDADGDELTAALVRNVVYTSVAVLNEAAAGLVVVLDGAT